MAATTPLGGTSLGAGSTFSLAGISLYALPDSAANSGGWEVPQEPTVGLELVKTVHRIPSSDPTKVARTIVQVWGVFPKPIEWSATWLGPGAEDRARIIMAAFVAQQPVNLTIGVRSWTVVIDDYSEKLHTDNEIYYSIKLTPISEDGGNLPSGNGVLSAAEQLALQQQALQLQLAQPILGDERALPTINDANALNTALNAAAPVGAASTTTLLALLSQTVLLLTDAQALRTLLQDQSDPTSLALYSWAGTTLGCASALYQTLGSLSGADGANSRQVSGTDLFTIAATELGDWTRWPDIAALSGLTDPFIDGPTTIIIPPA